MERFLEEYYETSWIDRSSYPWSCNSPRSLSEVLNGRGIRSEGRKVEGPIYNLFWRWRLDEFKGVQEFNRELNYKWINYCDRESRPSTSIRLATSNRRENCSWSHCVKNILLLLTKFTYYYLFVWIWIPCKISNIIVYFNSKKPTEMCDFERTKIKE